VDYSFDPFREAIGGDWYRDDALLGALVDHYASGEAAERRGLERFGADVAGPLARLAEESARPENAPRLRPFDAWHRRVDEIVLPASTRAALAVVAGRERLGALHGDPFAFYARSYLAHQNGEAGVACSLACTDGLTRLLAAIGDRPQHHTALAAMRASSSRSRRACRAVRHRDPGRLGRRRERGRGDSRRRRVPAARGEVVLLEHRRRLVPRERASARRAGRLEGCRDIPRAGVPERRRREAQRLHDRPAEGQARHARARDRRGHVQRRARLADRAARPRAREPGRPRARHLAHRLRVLRGGDPAPVRAHRRRVHAFSHGVRPPDRRLRAGEADPGRNPSRARACVGGRFRARALVAGARRDDEAADFRLLLSLAKPVLTRRASELAHDAVLLLGANGIEERFSPLPRLYRDAAVMETWEGPHNVLFAQALRDLVRLRVEPVDFAARMGGRANDSLATAVRNQLASSAATRMRC
jgi:hypothetical protein